MSWRRDLSCQCLWWRKSFAKRILSRKCTNIISTHIELQHMRAWSSKYFKHCEWVLNELTFFMSGNYSTTGQLCLDQIRACFLPFNNWDSWNVGAMKWNVWVVMIKELKVGVVKWICLGWNDKGTESCVMKWICLGWDDKRTYVSVKDGLWFPTETVVLSAHVKQSCMWSTA